MNRTNSPRALLAILALVVAAGCASYAGRGLQPGVARIDDVLALMGTPAMQWTEPDGAIRLAFPRGPEGTHTFMVTVGADGRLKQIVNVLDQPTFSLIVPGQDGPAEILKLLGPPNARQTMRFEARNVLVWEWLYCDSFSAQAWFGVEFAGTTGLVGRTYSRPDYRGWDGIVPHCGRNVQTPE